MQLLSCLVACLTYSWSISGQNVRHGGLETSLCSTCNLEVFSCKATAMCAGWRHAKQLTACIDLSSENAVLSILKFSFLHLLGFEIVSLVL